MACGSAALSCLLLVPDVGTRGGLAVLGLGSICCMHTATAPQGLPLHRLETEQRPGLCIAGRCLK